MRRPPASFLGSLALALILLSGCLGAAPPERTLEDASGTRVDVTDLSRVVATSHDLVEILFELGHEERVVAVPSWIDHPVEAKTLPSCVDDAETRCKLGRPHVLNVEEILAVDPSLVLLKDHPLQPTDLARGLRAAGVAVFVFENDETLENIHDTYETVGRILAPVDPDVDEEVEARRAALRAEAADIEARVARSDAPRPVALYQLPVSFVAGQGTSADLLLQMAGARNLAAEAGLVGYQQIAREVIAAGDPERIVAEFTAAASPDVFFANPRYEGTTAERLGPETLMIVDPATTALVGPRFLMGTREVAEWLHPVAFDQMEADVTFTEEGNRLDVTVRANGTQPFVHRMVPGDGSGPKDTAAATFSHTYSEPGVYDARLLVIDGLGRIHEVRRTIEV